MSDIKGDTILEASRVTRIFGGNEKQKAQARQLMDEGISKEEIYSKTGCTTALCNVSFRVKRGEIFVIIGLSGSGKSTIIRCFNKLVTPTDGYVLFEGRRVNEFSKRELTEFRRKNISMVFQSFGLFPHRSVLKNVAYGLEVRGVPRKEREENSSAQKLCE